MGEKILMSWSRKPLAIERPENVIQELYPNAYPAVSDEAAEIERALNEPAGKPPLRRLAAGKKRAVVIVSDGSRKFPRNLMLKKVISELTAAGVAEIQPIVAAGNHPAFPHEFDDYDPELLSGFPFIRNNSRELSEYRYLGATSSKVRGFFFSYARSELTAGLRRFPGDAGHAIASLARGRLNDAANYAKPDFVGNMLMGLSASLKTRVFIKKEVAAADLKVTIGQIKPHYFTGYGGGAKSILPGVAAITSIGPNHFMKSHPNAKLGIVRDNIVRQDMEEAARFCEPLFIVNAVMNREGRLARVVAGDVVTAHRAGVKVSQQIANVKAQKTDIVITSTPFPGSMNIYQVTKQVAPAAMLLKPRGVIICMGECPQGVGSVPVINHVIFNLGLKRYLPADVDILLVSSLPPEDVSTTFFRPMPDLAAALGFARAKLGPAATVTVVPDSGLIVPLTGENDARYWF